MKLSSEARVRRLEERFAKTLQSSRILRHFSTRVSLWHAEEEPQLEGDSIIWRSKFGPRRHQLRLADPSKVPRVSWNLPADDRGRCLVVGLDEVPASLVEDFVCCSLAEAVGAQAITYLIMGAGLAQTADGLALLQRARAGGAGVVVWLSSESEAQGTDWPEGVRWVSEGSLGAPELAERRAKGTYFALGPGLVERLPEPPSRVPTILFLGAGPAAAPGTDPMHPQAPGRYLISLEPSGPVTAETLRKVGEHLLEGVVLCLVQNGALQNEPLLQGVPHVTLESPARAYEQLSQLSELAVLRLSHGGARWARSHLSREALWQKLTCLTGGPCPRPARPQVSVICVSNRPERVSQILSTFEGFQYPNKELIVVLNAEHWSEKAYEQARERAPDAAFLRTTSTMSLGESLNLARKVAQGELWTKMDDDDHYGPQYLGDLVEALVLSGADVTGKGTFFTHVDGSGELYLRHEVEANAPSDRFLHGGTLLARSESTRGIDFRPVVRGTDSLFLQDCALRGLRIYAADSLNFAYVRYAKSGHHTYDVSKGEALANSRLLGSALEVGEVDA